jgi:predicted RNA-binding Zn-ribbon protein involved in translation (DUF1610 family)
MFKLFKRNDTDKVIRLVYPVDKALCPHCGAYITSKTCSKCKKLNKVKRNND